MNVRYRVELSQTERTELTALLSGGKHAPLAGGPQRRPMSHNHRAAVLEVG